MWEAAGGPQAKAITRCPAFPTGSDHSSVIRVLELAIFGSVFVYIYDRKS